MARKVVGMELFIPFDYFRHSYFTFFIGKSKSNVFIYIDLVIIK
jgi:hypothetical protein